MGGRVRTIVKCLTCRKSLMNPDVRVDDLPSIHLGAKVIEKTGNIYLSQIYGSLNKKFEDVDDIKDSVALFFCPHCHNPFPVHEMCECGAPMIDLNLEVGGVIKIGTRNACEHRSLQFVEADDMFSLFHDQDKSGLS